MDDNKITFRCLQVEQPIGVFYVGVIDCYDLLAISYADIRTLEERDLEKYLGIQRTLNPGRVDDIKKYVRTVGATFPTAVIVAVNSSDVEYSESAAAMTITRKESVAKIIDGQHRIAGLKGYEGPPFNLNVAVFVDMDIEEQAMVFATINLAQTKVSKSLAYDLYEYAKARSPQKTAHNIARLLNREPDSPFFQRIKVLGRATPGRDETITQAAFVESLLPYLSSDPVADRDLLKRGSSELDRRRPNSGDRRLFRNLFGEERDADIALTVWNFFSAVRTRWPAAWATKETGNILNRTTGLRALFRFLGDCVVALGIPDAVITEDKFSTILNDVRLNDGDFTPTTFPPGGSGESKLYKQLVTDTGSKRLGGQKTLDL